MKKLVWLCVAVLIASAGWVFRLRLEIWKDYVLINFMHQNKSVADRLEQYGAKARSRLGPLFAEAQVPYPPAAVVLAGFKEERRLELYAAGPDRKLRFIRSYDITAASGHAGPKLKEGDKQVPEGVYALVELNPNSLYHLSMRLDYPNEFDQAQAAREGRAKLGGDIMIHGNAVSVGCVAVGNAGSEDLFVLAADAGMDKVKVVLSPSDLRRSPPPAGPDLPSWTPELYRRLSAELSALP